VIADVSPFSLLVRLVAPLVWRSRRRTAQKLLGFSATEAGSALDMLKAAELCEEPALRRLFFRHALDEARHAELFREAARGLLPAEETTGSEWNLVHASRQDLWAKHDRAWFLAFVHEAEKAGAAQFAALAKHFAGTELGELFARIEKEGGSSGSWSRAACCSSSGRCWSRRSP
jgi:hypothetical protein